MEKINIALKKVNHYRIFEVIDTFKIEKNRNYEILKNWVKTSEASFTPFESQIIDEVRQQLEIKWDEWNEEELKMNCVGSPIHQFCFLCG